MWIKQKLKNATKTTLISMFIRFYAKVFYMPIFLVLIWSQTTSVQ